MPLFARAEVDYGRAAATATSSLAADAPNLHSTAPLADDPDSIRHLLAIEDPAITPDMIALLRALRRCAEPMRKTELIAAAALEPKRWNPTIKSLLDLGLVDKQGQGRGTRYLPVK
jgi:hypothetical protein